MLQSSSRNGKSTDGWTESVRRRGLALNYVTIGYNAAEAIASLIAGVLAGSVALVGFGLDSVIEVTAGAAAQWRLRTDHDPVGRARVELLTRRIIGWCFVALAGYVVYESGRTLLLRERPNRTVLGVAILSLSVVAMPMLARAKRHVARELESPALTSESKQTSLCGYLSAISLGGVLLNALLGWWWADPVAALAMVPIMVIEGASGIRRRDERDGCC